MIAEPHLDEAHGISEPELQSWGGEFVYALRPEQSLYGMRDGDVDAVLQEAIMTPNGARRWKRATPS